MNECQHCNFPVMVSFHNMSGSVNSFQLVQEDKSTTLRSILEEKGPPAWLAMDVSVKVSTSRSGHYDKFSLDNQVNLVSQILKTDVIWVIFERNTPPPIVICPKNAFDVLKQAAKSKTLPDPLINPINQKQDLFNNILKYMRDQEVSFSISDCAPRIKNRKTGVATELMYSITDIVWGIGQSIKQLKGAGLWNKIPTLLSDLAMVDQKSKEPIRITQTSAKEFATQTREIASKALMANSSLESLKMAMLSTAEVFVEYSNYLKSHLESVKKKLDKDKLIGSAAEAVVIQVSNREKVTIIEPGTKPLKNITVENIFKTLVERGIYQPVNISTLLPVNRYSRSSILHRDLPNQAPGKLVLWTFDNWSSGPQSVFAFIVDPNDSEQIILDKINELKPSLVSLQKIYFPREFYQQFYSQVGSVTGISSQDLKLVCGMVMGDDRKFDSDVQERFEEAIMSGDPDFVYDMRYFNGRDIKYKEVIKEFRSAIQEYMVEDRGRHETHYDGTIVSKVSFGFSLRQMFEDVCKKVKEKDPECPLPKSEAMITRYLIPRTKAAAKVACRSETLIPLKLAMQQKVIEKPNVDAHYNAAQYKYLRSFAVKFGPDIVTMIGWDDKTGVDVGEPEQPTAATQHAGRSWVLQDRPVGEGQHSFHKTNLTPSVRLVHELGESIESSFYRGLPQVVIKDSIFEPSNSARHVTELFQMFQSNPELLKKVLIITNDGGVDHTIRHERNIVAMLALFLRLPETLLMINFQMAAYRSAYHPVEKLNCILNLAWNGVSLSRDTFDDPVLENVFSQCSSMADVRKKAEKHSGIKDALKKSLQPSVEILEERAKQASLKENSFEVFKPATTDEIKDFLSIILDIDPNFDIDRFLDKKKPYHYSTLLKAHIDNHLESTHYSLTFKKHEIMSKEFLDDKYPENFWPGGLEPLPCPLLDKQNTDRYISYEEVNNLDNKDYTDTCRPGKNLKIPTNIPFVKNKQRASYGAKLPISCEVCNKSRVVYVEHRLNNEEVNAAKEALKNMRYICGGRLSSFGRSLAVMEEITESRAPPVEIVDEIEKESRQESNTEWIYNAVVDISDELDDFEEHSSKRKKDGLTYDSDVSSVGESDLAEQSREEHDILKEPVRKKKMVIESDDSDSFDEVSGSKDPDISGFLDIISNPNQTMSVTEGFINTEVPDMDSANDPCFFCDRFRTSHKCKICKVACCNLCNTEEEVDEITDIVCQNCKESVKSKSTLVSKTRGRGRPKKKVESGTVLISLAKRKIGRPRKEPVTEDLETETNHDSDNNGNLDIDKTSDEEPSTLSELRMLGSGCVLKKLFVDESLICESPIEPHMFDVLISLKESLPCSHCGEKEESKISSNLTEECFPLCLSCQLRGRGAGARRKSRKIKPKPMKIVKPRISKKNKNKRRNLI